MQGGSEFALFRLVADKKDILVGFIAACEKCCVVFVPIMPCACQRNVRHLGAIRKAWIYRTNDTAGDDKSET